MPLRVTRSGMYQQTQSLLGRSTQQMVQLQLQLATMRRINRPSDDPTGSRRALQLRSELNGYTRYLDNINGAQSRVEHATSVLTSISERVARVRALAMQANSPDVSQSMRPGIAEEINAILQGLVDDANTMHDGRYLFAGNATGSKPFVTDAGPGGNTTRVTYQGDMGATWVTVGADALMQVNENGYEGFMAGGAGEDLFSVVAQTRDLVANTGGLPDAELAQALSDQLAAIDTVHNSVLGSTARLAGRAKSLELRQSMYEDAEIAATRSLADVEDADVAEVVYRLQMERNQFEALLAGSATLLKPTLMDFLT